MNLEDLIDPKYGLQQDEWSLTAPRFGEEGQLQVIGWSGRQRTHKLYILKCVKCLQDSELFGNGLFKCSKSNLIKGQIPCGCGKSRWTELQKTIIARRVLLPTPYTLNSVLPFEGKDLIDIHCAICAKDPELFGQGNFITPLSNMRKGQIPCGCSKSISWNKEQYTTMCTRKAKELGYLFKGFIGDWKGKNTNIILFCEKHGEWTSGIISTLVHVGQGCPQCGFDSAAKARIKPDEVMIESFLASGAFHPDTKFWRSEKTNAQGRTICWRMACPECGTEGESASNNLQQGQRPCLCSTHSRQQECYINLVLEAEDTVAIKFGITANSQRRVKQQNAASVFKVISHSVYYFPDVVSCKQAERECKKELECGILLKRDMKDGYTETTWTYNLDKIIEIYERNGGTKIE